jgi:hypothetical protein
MSSADYSQPLRRERRAFRRLAVLAGAAIALLPGAALAQDPSSISPDRNGVMIVTAVVSILALIACAIGYAWRRMEGMDHPTPDELQMMSEHGEHDEHDEHAPAAAHH